VNAENNTAMPASFLMQQMDWREALDDAESADDLMRLGRLVKEAKQAMLVNCAQFLDEQHDYAKAVQEVRALMFVERFAADLDARLDQMETQERGQ
jgi:molecular chaperone HscB